MKQLGGAILLAVGILIAGASGLCSIAILFSSGGELGSGLGMLPLVAIVGGIPFAAGTGIALAGRGLIRRARKDKSQPSLQQLEKIYGDSPNDSNGAP